MNHVTLIGNLATDVSLKELGDDKRVADFLLAVDRPGEGKGADFIRVTVWERQADACAQYLAKGSHVAVDGRLKSRSWEEEGKRRTAVDVVANRVQFLPGRGSETPFEAAAAT